MPVPNEPKIYHIVHVDRLPSIVANGALWCDAEVNRRAPAGTKIGMNDIKRRRLEELTLHSHPELHVGDCVPFYFCPRSVMLYVIHRANHDELDYRGGQGPIVHLEADLWESVAWAEAEELRWAFTLSNAGAFYFEDRADLGQLDQLNWPAIQATDWRGRKEGKQAEFLMEGRFPWELVSRIGVHSPGVARQTLEATRRAAHRPPVEVRLDWYY